MLTTPITAVELLLGKAAAIFVPAIGVSYLMFGVFVAITQFAARPAVATAVLHAPQLPAALVFIPLLAAGRSGSAWRSPRGPPTPASPSSSASWPACRRSRVTALMSFQVLSPTFGLAAAFAGGLLVIDCAACFAVARLFDRERLITGTRPTSGTGQPRYRARGAS